MKSPRRSPFTYTGRTFSELTGRPFQSVAEFCRAARINPGMVYNRVNHGWPLIKALDTPKLEMGGSRGMIYKVTRRSSGQSYVGLTIVSLKARWAQHVRSARRRNSPLAQAIVEDGPEGFIVEPIEVDISLGRVADRERYWITALGTSAPYGLNKHPGGAVGGGNHREIEHDGARFRSLAEASEALATQHGLTPSAAHQRLVKGKSLEA